MESSKYFHYKTRIYLKSKFLLFVERNQQPRQQKGNAEYWHFCEDTERECYILSTVCQYYTCAFQISQFFSCFSSSHLNMSFMTETEQNFRRPFLDVNIISKQGIFTITVPGKQTFSVVYIHFKKSLKKDLPNTCKISVLHILLDKCFRMCSNESIFQLQLTLLKEISLKKWSSRKLR